ncbi:hypothetical protein GCM10027048_04440 [Hymenobacter coalescens]
MLNASVLVSVVAAALLTTADNPACQARLEVQQAGAQLTVIGHCRNGAPDAARWYYELRTEKQGRSGSAQNAQSGRFVAQPGQDVILSSTTMNLSAQDICRLQLRVLDERGTVLAIDSLQLPAPR